MKKRYRNVLILTGTVAIIAGLILPKFNFFQTAAEDTGRTTPQQQKTLVKSYVVKPDLLHQRVVTSGTVVANERVELRSEVAGKVTAIHFQEGSRVSEGDLLLKINDAELRAQLLKLEQQKALAEDKEYRQRQLLKKQAISQENYDQTLNELETLTAEIALVGARIDKMEIRAPFDGFIGLRYVSIGDYISPSTRIASLQNIDPIKIDFSIPEKYTPVVSAGDHIQFTAESLPESYEGEVYAIEPNIDSETRTLQLREAQRSFIQAESRLVAVKYQGKLAETELKRLTGQLLQSQSD